MSHLHRRRSIKALFDPLNPSGSSIHVNWVVLNSRWEAEFCRFAEKISHQLPGVKRLGTCSLWVFRKSPDIFAMEKQFGE